jgi:hypothetical protein
MYAAGGQGLLDAHIAKWVKAVKLYKVPAGLPKSM